jgi:SAM-dependent methyltransferase
VTTDAAPGMEPDVVCRAEDLPFADGSFDLVVTRVAAHHFDDVAAAATEMARVADDRLIVVDALYSGEALEEAERLRDPSHVRSYSEEEWRAMLEDAGLRVADVQIFSYPVEFQPWLDRTGCTGDDAAQVRELASDRIADGWITFERIAVMAVKR